ncbi:MAG: hypothetical protein JJE16_15730 [Nitrospiraceae bacterium]|nr:hypothetical protein [Nitrospiraceae bacterium]
MYFLQQCLAGAGFDVKVDVNAGTIEGDMGGQEGAYDAAFEACQSDAVAAGLDIPFVPPTQEELRLWYKAYELVQSCLVENDFPTTPMPSLETFLADDGRWHPYDAVYTGILSTASEEALLAVCSADLRELIPQVIGSG